MAQGPEYLIHLTDGDRGHIPNSPQELQYGYAPANEALTQRACENIAKEIMKNAGGGKFEKGESERIFVLDRSACYHRMQKLSNFIFSEDKIPRVEPLVPFVCDPGPLFLVLVAKATTCGLGAKRVCVQATSNCHKCEPLSRSLLLSLQVLFNFHGSRCYHEDDEGCPWRTTLAWARYQLEFKPLAVLSATSATRHFACLWL